MYIHKEKSIAFIAHPRTASMAMAETLLGMGFSKIGTHHQYEKPWCLDTTFSVVRNPFDVMVSWYYYKECECGLTFDEWLPTFFRDPPYCISHGLFFGHSLCTDVLWYENLQEEFDMLMARVGLPQTDIVKSNVSERREGRDFMRVHTDATLERTGSFFQDEIEQFDYAI